MPDAHLARETEAGQRIAQGILERHPKLNVMFLSGRVLEKVGGIDVTGAGTPTPEVGFVLPLEEWECLTKAEQVNLSYYVEAAVASVRMYPDRYMIISMLAPDYRSDIDYLEAIADGSWFIGSTKSFSDDPEGHLYLDRTLVQGDAAWARNQRGQRASTWRQQS